MTEFPHYLSFFGFEFCISVIRDCFEFRLPAGRQGFRASDLALSDSQNPTGNGEFLNFLRSFIEFK